MSAGDPTPNVTADNPAAAAATQDNNAAAAPTQDNNAAAAPTQDNNGGTVAAAPAAGANPTSTVVNPTSTVAPGVSNMGTVKSALDKTQDAENGAVNKAAEDIIEYGLISKCFAEFLGCFIHVFVCTMQSYGSGDLIIHSAFAQGFTIFILVSSMGHISGGHFNPAVSTGVFAARKLHWIHWLAYMGVQLFGGFIGSIMGMLVLGKDTFIFVGYGATFTSPTSDWYQCLIAEAIGSMFLVNTVLLSAVDTNLNLLAPLAIGCTVAADLFAFGKITGGSMNPARSFGPNLVATFFNNSKLPPGFWSMHAVYYLAGPMIGAGCAAGFHKLFFAREKRIIRW